MPNAYFLADGLVQIDGVALEDFLATQERPVAANEELQTNGLVDLDLGNQREPMRPHSRMLIRDRENRLCTNPRGCHCLTKRQRRLLGNFRQKRR